MNEPIPGVAIYRLQEVCKRDTYEIYEVLNGICEIRNIKLLELRKGTTIPGHKHHYRELTWIMSGHVEYRLVGHGGTDAVVELMADEIMLKQPHVWHQITVLEDTKLLCCGEQPFVSSGFNNLT